MSESEANRSLVRRLFEEVFDQRRVDVCAEVVAEQYAEHAVEPFGSEEPGAVDGPAHLRGVVEWLTAPTSRDHRGDGRRERPGHRAGALGGTNLGLNGFLPPTGRAFTSAQTPMLPGAGRPALRALGRARRPHHPAPAWSDHPPRSTADPG